MSDSSVYFRSEHVIVYASEIKQPKIIDNLYLRAEGIQMYRFEVGDRVKMYKHVDPECRTGVVEEVTSFGYVIKGDDFRVTVLEAEVGRNWEYNNTEKCYTEKQVRDAADKILQGRMVWVALRKLDIDPTEVRRGIVEELKKQKNVEYNSDHLKHLVEMLQAGQAVDSPEFQSTLRELNGEIGYFKHQLSKYWGSN